MCFARPASNDVLHQPRLAPAEGPVERSMLDVVVDTPSLDTMLLCCCEGTGNSAVLNMIELFSILKYDWKRSREFLLWGSRNQ